MITFIDGPAKGVELSCRRAPVMLRVVQSSRGNWDALDQASDSPRSQETIFVYILANKPEIYFIRSHKPTLSGAWAKAAYRVWIPQPNDSRVRVNNDWRRWVSAEIDEIRGQLPAGVTLRKEATYPEGLL